MTRLSVNVNKVATLRNARGGNNPDVVKVALDCEAFGADGITVHPRPDERHIRKSDVFALKSVLKTEFNIEGNPTEFNQAGIRTSVFVNADPVMVEYAAKAGADRVELYTEPYASFYDKDKEAAVAPFVEAAKVARSFGLGLNSGHDLSLHNLEYYHQCIPWLDEVSIGHALICDALYLGLKKTVEEYKRCLI